MKDLVVFEFLFMCQILSWVNLERLNQILLGRLSGQSGRKLRLIFLIYDLRVILLRWPLTFGSQNIRFFGNFAIKFLVRSWFEHLLHGLADFLLLLKLELGLIFSVFNIVLLESLVDFLFA